MVEGCKCTTIGTGGLWIIVEDVSLYRANGQQVFTTTGSDDNPTYGDGWCVYIDWSTGTTALNNSMPKANNPVADCETCLTNNIYTPTPEVTPTASIPWTPTLTPDLNQDRPNWKGIKCYETAPSTYPTAAAQNAWNRNAELTGGSVVYFTSTAVNFDKTKSYKLADGQCLTNIWSVATSDPTGGNATTSTEAYKAVAIGHQINSMTDNSAFNNCNECEGVSTPTQTYVAPTYGIVLIKSCNSSDTTGLRRAYKVEAGKNIVDLTGGPETSFSHKYAGDICVQAVSGDGETGAAVVVTYANDPAKFQFLDSELAANGQVSVTGGIFTWDPTGGINGANGDEISSFDIMMTDDTDMVADCGTCGGLAETDPKPVISWSGTVSGAHYLTSKGSVGWNDLTIENVTIAGSNLQMYRRSGGSASLTIEMKNEGPPASVLHIGCHGGGHSGDTTTCDQDNNTNIAKYGWQAGNSNIMTGGATQFVNHQGSLYNGTAAGRWQSNPDGWIMQATAGDPPWFWGMTQNDWDDRPTQINGGASLLGTILLPGPAHSALTSEGLKKGVARATGDTEIEGKFYVQKVQKKGSATSRIRFNPVNAKVTIAKPGWRTKFTAASAGTDGSAPGWVNGSNIFENKGEEWFHCCASSGMITEQFTHTWNFTFENWGPGTLYRNNDQALMGVGYKRNGGSLWYADPGTYTSGNDYTNPSTSWFEAQPPADGDNNFSDITSRATTEYGVSWVTWPTSEHFKAGDTPDAKSGTIAFGQGNASSQKPPGMYIVRFRYIFTASNSLDSSTPMAGNEEVCVANLAYQFEIPAPSSGSSTGQNTQG
jgi:hypothetical protein